MKTLKKRCIVCGKMSEMWQRTNNSPYYCFDGCYSTTGKDNRTKNGEPLWEGNEPLDADKLKML